MKDKLVHAGAPLVLLFLIRKLQDLTSSCLKVFEILLFFGSCRSSFPRSFPNWEITGPCQLLLKII